MSDPPTASALAHLFSYGTLQLETVQWSVFGRKLEGTPDQLPGYRMGWQKIIDPAVAQRSGKTHHPMIAYTGRLQDRVPGTALRLTEHELGLADAYEVPTNRRRRVTLASGQQAWVYADAGAANANP